MRAAIAAILVLGVSPARAELPGRVIIADGDPELVRAVERVLAPWRFTIVVEPAPVTEREAPARATLRDARFIVWRQRGELVVLDRETGLVERRPARDGSLDAVDAAAAALTVKTMMRLPAPPDEEPAIGTPIVAPAPATPGPELRVQAGLGGRFARGSQDDLGLRTTLAVMVRPWGTRGLRLGVIGELGTAPDVSSGSFEGEWSDWSLAGFASWAVTPGALVVEPFVGAGLARVSLSGVDQTASRDETSSVPLARAGAMVRWQLDWWSLGMMASVDTLLSTPTYTRVNMGMGMGTQELFEGPSVAFGVGVMAAIDLGR